jgi:AcrR family transcriptional regulator
VVRPKRTPDEIRELLLRAGLHCFARNGFAGATTRQIATEAGVAEMLLYRHFDSKAGLFDAAVVKPFKRALDAHVDKWDSLPKDVSAEEITADFLANVYGLLHEQRDIVVALLAANAHDRELGGTLSGLFAQSVERITKFIARMSEAREYRGVDAEVAVQATLSMVMGMSVMDELLLRPGHSHSRERQIREMTQLIVHGMTHRS